MKYIVEKDEMGVINYYNLEKKLLMQEYQTADDTITLYYHDKKIVKIKANNLELALDLNGNILTADFNNGVTAYFASKHQKIVFLDTDGEYLGSLNMNIEPIYSSNRIYIINKIINKLNETMPILMENKYSVSIENVNDKIHQVNNEMVSKTVAILSQDNRRSIEKILSDYRKQEIRDKKFLSLRRKKLSKEQYAKKYDEITMKYATKRSQLKSRYNYLAERRKLEELQAELFNNQNDLDELLLEKRNIYNEYLTR